LCRTFPSIAIRYILLVYLEQKYQHTRKCTNNTDFSYENQARFVGIALVTIPTFKKKYTNIATL